MQCTIVQCMSCCCSDKVMERCHAYCCHLLMSTYWAHMLIDEQHHHMLHVYCAPLHASAESLSLWQYRVSISLRVQSLYLPDSTTSSISAVIGSSAADSTAVCLCNDICLGCAASDCLITRTGSPAGLMLWLCEFVFCAKISSAKKYFCSKGAHCALTTLYDDYDGKHIAMAKHTIQSDRIIAAAQNYILACSRQVL